MSICVVYDDLTAVPDDVQSLVGVSRFSAVLYRKRTLLHHLNDLMNASGIREFFHLQRPADLDRLRAHVADLSHARRYLYFPSHIVPRDLADAQRFFQKIQFSRRNLLIKVDPAAANAPILLLDGGHMRDMLGAIARRDWPELIQAHSDDLATVHNDARLRDISSYSRFVEFLSSNFDVRHFNSVAGDEFAVRKHSADKVKIRREFTFHTLLEGPVQAFFLRPFDYEEDAAGAGYSLERLHVPDASIQWVHGAFSDEEFRQFLAGIERFMRVRPVRGVSREAFERCARDAYVSKVQERLKAFKALPCAAGVDALLARSAAASSLDTLAERWGRLWDRLHPGALEPRLAFAHGDLCFSNILYDKRTRLTKFIDPRGAETADELYGHPYYDAAKLSHSVLGGYDFINHNLFDINFDDGLRVELRLFTPAIAGAQRMFVELMTALGFDYELMRLFEASLFLSMLPLHADVPKKTLAFALTAEAILTELEAKRVKWKWSVARPADRSAVPQG